MDDVTRLAMQRPRCGHHDQTRHIKPRSLAGRIRRYLLLGTVWKHMSLTYKITKFSSKLPRQGTKNAARKAFKVGLAQLYWVFLYNATQVNYIIIKYIMNISIKYIYISQIVFFQIIYSSTFKKSIIIIHTIIE